MKVLFDLVQEGHQMLLCDMITNSLSHRFGLTSLPITSGSERIQEAFKRAIQAVSDYKQYAFLADFYKLIFEENPSYISVFDESKKKTYFSKNYSFSKIVIEEMKNGTSIRLLEKRKRAWDYVTDLPGR